MKETIKQYGISINDIEFYQCNVTLHANTLSSMPRWWYELYRKTAEDETVSFHFYNRHLPGFCGIESVSLDQRRNPLAECANMAEAPGNRCQPPES